MKALLLSEYRHLEVADVPGPTIAPDEVLIEVAACGICVGDVKGYDGSGGLRIPPIVMGHEAAGTVFGVGSDVTGFLPGDRVTFDSTVFCGSCEFCLAGDINLCIDRQVFGVSCGEYRRTGAFAEFLTVPARVTYALPDALSFTEAAMLKAVATALHGISVSEMKGEETVLVIGAGMHGLLLMQAARAAGFGAARVLISDINPERLKLAEELGAEETLLASGAELTAEVMLRTGGRGVDIALETVGLDETIATAIDCARCGGTVTLIDHKGTPVNLPLETVISRQIRLQGSCASAGEYPEAMDLVASGKIRVGALITAVAPLSAGPSWFQRLQAHEPNLMKIVLDPREVDPPPGHTPEIAA